MESVYIETTLLSYLVARPSRDLIVAAPQQITNEWWSQHRSHFECYVSKVVIDEASAGEPDEVSKRLGILADLLVREAVPEAEELATALLASGVTPPRAVGDAAPYRDRDGQRRRLPVDLELQAPGQRPDNAQGGDRVPEVRASHARDLHARRAHGRLNHV